MRWIKQTCLPSLRDQSNKKLKKQVSTARSQQKEEKIHTYTLALSFCMLEIAQNVKNFDKTIVKRGNNV